MTSREKVLTRLDSTGIRREDEAAVPVNGLTVPLPYMVIRTIEKDTWDDLGRVCVKTIMTDLVEVVRDTSDESRAEILALLQQLNTLVDSDTVGTLIAQINNAVKKSGDTMTGDLNMGGHAIIGAELTQIVQATLTAAGWSASAPYTQTVAVAGVTAGSPPYITPVYSGVVDADIALREACAAVSYAKPGAGTVTFVCLENKPETNIPVQVEVKR